MKSPVKHAIESAALCLLVAACALWFVISLNESGEADHAVAKIVLAAITLGVAMVLHLVFVALAVYKDGRPLLGWMALSILLCPVGSIITMVLLAWLATERDRAQAQA